MGDNSAHARSTGIHALFCPETAISDRLNKYEKFGRRAQVDYLTTSSRVFSVNRRVGKRITDIFRQAVLGTLRSRSTRTMQQRRLVLLMETYGDSEIPRFDRALGGKTPANRRFIPQFWRFCRRNF